jgi:PAS domain S-box-containing protein
MSMDAARDSLRVVRQGGPDEPLKIFCGHCGRVPDKPGKPGAASRVCSKCGMGLLLQAPAETAPSEKDPFMVIDGALTICDVSRQAERLLGITETECVNRHVAEFLVPADSETGKDDNLASLLAWAARGETPSGNVVVRPTNTFGVRYWARVGPCGPPSAALLVLADAR